MAETTGRIPFWLVGTLTGILVLGLIVCLSILCYGRKQITKMMWVKLLSSSKICMRWSQGISWMINSLGNFFVCFTFGYNYDYAFLRLYKPRKLLISYSMATAFWIHHKAGLIEGLRE